jgi:hypothetical protein
MKDKIYTLLKDIIIYLFPGIIIMYCLTLIFGFNLSQLGDISKTNIVFVGVIFSFLVGFTTTQLQIIVFLFLMKKSNKITLAYCTLPNYIESKIALKVIDTFDFNGVSEKEIIKDSSILGLCKEYVAQRSNSEAISMIERDSYLSSLAFGSFIPLTLSIFSLININQGKISLGDGFIDSIAYLILIAIIFLIILRKIGKNFRKGHAKKVFQQFLIIAMAKESTAI